MPLFATMNTSRICREISQSKSSIILVAPGINCEIAKEIVSASHRLTIGSVKVVLDVSANVARLGFGDHSAVELLKANGLEVRHQPGVRIGLLICDGHGWSFTSTPRLVEDDPIQQSEAYNAIALTEAQVMVLRSELPQTREIDSSQSDNASNLIPVVGNEKLDDATLQKVKTALEIAPPQTFNLARQAQVYTALIEFVELTFEGFKLQSRRVQLPNTLPLLASKDKAFKERLFASLKLLDKFEGPVKLRNISTSLEELREAFLHPTGPAGRVMLKSKRQEFEGLLNVIERDLIDCKEDIKKELDAELTKVIDTLTPELARAVMSDPPLKFRGLYPQSKEAAEQYVREELRKAFPKAEPLVEGMKIHKFYKDVTYATLRSKDFEEKVKSIIGPSIIKDALLVEETAALSQVIKN